jgi:hypothetical protein
LPPAPGDEGEVGDPKGFSLSKTGELRGCSSGVFAADEPGEAGRSSSGYGSAKSPRRAQRAGAMGRGNVRAGADKLRAH